MNFPTQLGLGFVFGAWINQAILAAIDLNSARAGEWVTTEHIFPAMWLSIACGLIVRGHRMASRT